MDTVAFICKTQDGLVYNLPVEMEWGISSEVEMQSVLYGLIRYIKPSSVFESGCAFGFATVAMGQACRENGFGQVVSCDIEERYACSTKSKVGHLPVDVRTGNSLTMPELGTADFIFSDSSYEARQQEYEKAKAGAIIVMHDANQEKQIGDFVRAHGGVLISRGRGFGILTKF